MKLRSLESCWKEKKRELTVTGSVDDSSLVAPRWHPPELRGGLAVLRFLLLLLDGVEGGRRRCRRSAQFQEFATDAVEAVVIGGVVGGGAGRRRQQRARHLDEPEKGQVLRTAFVQRFAGAL